MRLFATASFVTQHVLITATSPAALSCVAVAQQRLAHLVRVDVRDLAAEKVDRERRHGGDRMRYVARETSHAQPSSVRRATCSNPGSAGVFGREVAGGDERRALDARRERLDGFERDVRDDDVCSRQALVRRDEPRVERDAVRRGVRARRLDRRLLDVDRDDGREAEQRGRDREDAGAAADVEQRAWLELLQRGETELCRRVRPGAERAPGIDHDDECVVVRRFPRRPDPEAADAHRPVEGAPPVLPAALDVGGSPAAEERPHALLAGGVGVGGELDAALAVDLLEALGEELEHRRARLLGALVADLDRDAAKRAQRNALFSFSKKLSSCR